MYRVVVFCGGRGGREIIKGFQQLYGLKNIDLHIIINAYDDGLSTGECRRVFDGQILGPSDLRKNHITLYELINEKKINDPNSYESKFLKLLKFRFTEDDAESAYKKCVEYLKDSVFLGSDKMNYFLKLIDYFFVSDGKIRNSVEKISFNDFSMSNIFYSSCAARENNSLCRAGQEMARIINVPDIVHLISDKSLFLKAVTESGHYIESEEEVVSWNRLDDKIKEIVLLDPMGNKYTPSVDENIKDGILNKDLIRNSDVIIFSSGTQWSSMIPTYMHNGFNELIQSSSAKKYLVMNNCEDEDMIGVNATDICDIVGKYICLDEVKIVINKNASKGMNVIKKRFNSIVGKLGESNDRNHNPRKLVAFLMNDYFECIKGDTHFVFDFDGTIWDGEVDSMIFKSGLENLDLFPGIILSGNTSDHIYSVIKKYCHQSRKIPIYSNYGNTYLLFGGKENEKELSSEFKMDQEVLRVLSSRYPGLCSLRGDAVLTIKPLDNRDYHIKEICKLLMQFNGRYCAYIAGKTSIDIMDRGYGKATMLSYIMDSLRWKREKTVFVGNEINKGNEEGMKNIGIKCINVRDVFECNILLKTINTTKKQ